MKYSCVAHPGKSKRLRWHIALHEASHGLAYRELGCVASTCYIVNERRGVCRHAFVADLKSDAVCVAAGPAGEWLTMCPPPPGRPRNHGRPVIKFAKTDAGQLSDFVRLAKYEAQIGEPPAALVFDHAEIVREAEHFVVSHMFEILELARRLFLCGRLHVHARKPTVIARANVSPGQQISHIAASAAEGL